MTQRGGEPGEGARQHLRVAIQQPNLPRYRVGLFRRINAFTDLDLTLLHGSEAPQIPNAEADGFATVEKQQLALPSQRKQVLLWHQGHLDAIDRHKYDVAVLSWNTRYLSLWFALLKAWFQRFPVVLWGHGYSKHTGRFAAVRSFLRRLPLRFARAAVLYDYHTAEQMRAMLPARLAGNLFVAANGLDPDATNAAKAAVAQESTNGQYRQPVIHNRLAFIGRLYPENRLDIVISAMPRMATRIPGICLRVIGGGEAEQRRLTALAESLGVASRIEWLGPKADEIEIARLLQGADVLVHPSHIGLSLMHGFSYGLPMITCGPTAQHGPEVWALQPGENGLVLEGDDADAFADATTALLMHPERLFAMQHNAQSTVANDFNHSAMARAFREAIRHAARPAS